MQSARSGRGFRGNCYGKDASSSDHRRPFAASSTCYDSAIARRLAQVFYYDYGNVRKSCTAEMSSLYRKLIRRNGCCLAATIAIACNNTGYWLSTMLLREDDGSEQTTNMPPDELTRLRGGRQHYFQFRKVPKMNGDIVNGSIPICERVRVEPGESDGGQSGALISEGKGHLCPDMLDYSNLQSGTAVVACNLGAALGATEQANFTQKNNNISQQVTLLALQAQVLSEAGNDNQVRKSGRGDSSYEEDNNRYRDYGTYLKEELASEKASFAECSGNSDDSIGKRGENGQGGARKWLILLPRIQVSAAIIECSLTSLLIGLGKLAFTVTIGRCWRPTRQTEEVSGQKNANLLSSEGAEVHIQAIHWTDHFRLFTSKVFSSIRLFLQSLTNSSGNDTMVVSTEPDRAIENSTKAIPSSALQMTSTKHEPNGDGDEQRCNHEETTCERQAMTSADYFSETGISNREASRQGGVEPLIKQTRDHVMAPHQPLAAADSGSDSDQQKTAASEHGRQQQNQAQQVSVLAEHLSSLLVGEALERTAFSQQATDHLKGSSKRTEDQSSVDEEVREEKDETKDHQHQVAQLSNQVQPITSEREYKEKENLHLSIPEKNQQLLQTDERYGGEYEEIPSSNMSTVNSRQVNGSPKWTESMQTHVKSFASLAELDSLNYREEIEDTQQLAAEMSNVGEINQDDRRLDQQAYQIDEEPYCDASGQISDDYREALMEARQRRLSASEALQLARTSSSFGSSTIDSPVSPSCSVRSFSETGEINDESEVVMDELDGVCYNASKDSYNAKKPTVSPEKMDREAEIDPQTTNQELKNETNCFDATETIIERPEPAGETDSDERREDGDDFCTAPASDATLRRLRLSALEDISIACRQNRESMATAKKLFSELARKQEQCDQPTGRPVNGGKQDHKVAQRRCGSLSSGSNNDDEDYDGNNSDDRADQRDNFGSIKVVGRSGSSASSTNFRRTLICSVSPISPSGGSSSDMSGDLLINNATINDGTLTNGLMMSSMSATGSPGADPYYPIDSDEIVQCRAAFRENRKLIEEQQERAVAAAQQQRELQFALRSQLAPGDTSHPQTTEQEHHEWRLGSANKDNRQDHHQRRTWKLRSNQDIEREQCSKCHKRVYPVDRLELDFTRTKLNIHRNCFKCQTCSSLLRLETYAAIDARLYCPAHVRSATTTPFKLVEGSPFRRELTSQK